VLTQHPGWTKLRAVKNGKVFLTDGNAYFNRPGPRLVDSLEILAEIIHPQWFDFGYGERG
ncbi:MAG: ABC transporter substrate-binding protein, partial [Microcystaceae cyanobacterium]